MDLGFVEIALLAAAVLVGATGTWSPCGFSMIETIGPTGHTGGRWVTPAACATFLPGAVVGAVITFGGLALVGSALPGAGSRTRSRRRSPSAPRSRRRAARGSRRRSGASFPSTGAG